MCTWLPYHVYGLLLPTTEEGVSLASVMWAYVVCVMWAHVVCVMWARVVCV